MRREAKRWITPLVSAAPVVEARDRHPSSRPAKGEVVSQLGRGHDEGDLIDEARYDKVKARHDALPAATQFWLGAVAAEANQAGVAFYLSSARTFRRYWLYAALIILAEDGVGDDLEVVRALAALATGSDAPHFPTVTVGHAVGAMGVDEARGFCQAAADLPRRAAPRRLRHGRPASGARLIQPTNQPTEEPMPFNDPGTGGDRIDYKPLDGALLLFDVKAVEDGVVTTYGERTAIRADVAVLDGLHKGERYTDALVFPMVLVGQLRGSEGAMVLGRLGQGAAKPGQNAPWTLATATDADKAVGERYLAYAEAQRAPVPADEEPF